MSWWWRKLIGKQAEKRLKEIEIEKQIEAAKKLRTEQTRRLTERRVVRSTPSYSSSYTSNRRDSDDALTDLATLAVVAAAASSYDSGSTSWSPSDSSSSSDSWSGGGGDSGGGGSSGDW